MMTFNLNGKSYPIWINQKGYACVTLQENGSDRAYLLHRLVWRLEHGAIPDGYELHHVDRNKANWSIDNLLLVDRQTHQEIHRQDRRSTDIDHKAGKDTNPKSRPR